MISKADIESQLQHYLVTMFEISPEKITRDARLFEDLVLGHVRHHLPNIRVLDAAQ